jgi:hypothetical protein
MKMFHNTAIILEAKYVNFKFNLWEKSACISKLDLEQFFFSFFKIWCFKWEVEKV